MVPTGKLDSEVVRAVQRETNEKRKRAAVRHVLNEHLRLRKQRKLADLAGAVDIRCTNDELEAIEEG